jgi:hypothetical protein
VNGTQVASKSPKWLLQIVKWIDSCEKKLPEPAFMKGEFPEWVERLARELISTLYPTAKLKVGKAWTAAEVGAMLGHRLAYLHGIEEHLPESAVGKPFKGLDKKVVKRIRKEMKAFLEAFEVSMGRSLVLASVQSHGESAQFFTAFAKGLSKLPSDAQASNFHRTTTRVYWLMLWGWRSVEKLKSVRELQQGLCKYLEPYVVGDVKRIEKMCQRLGLRFGKPGRPRLVSAN